MAYVITQACCNDASCVTVCPVNCIHPTPAERGFMTTEMLYIDPATCIDCGACVDACPVEAIRLDAELADDELRFKDINAAYFTHHPTPSTPVQRPAASTRAGRYSGLRVAIVGSGPAAHYAAAEVLAQPGTEVDMYERLLTPYGLIRSGVAPDHPGTKAVVGQFGRTAKRPGFHLHLGVEIGKNLSHADLLARHSAVVYAVGASSDRRLGIAGEDLRGVHGASEFVAWYNGHPDFADRKFDLSGTRVVIVGNGNVALDIARILVTDPERLAATDIAEHALVALRESRIREVVVVGRRGPAQAAYTTPELFGLLRLADVDVVVDAAEATLDPLTQDLFDRGAVMASARMKTDLAGEIAARKQGTSSRRIVLRYLASPTAISGSDRATGITLVRNRLVAGDDGALEAVATGETESFEAGLVLRSIGYRGSEIAGLPFESGRGVVPNVRGRVVDTADRAPVAGVYATGWIKRGPTGVIGTNKQCARETVGALFDDFEAGVIGPAGDRASLDRLIAERCPDALDLEGWNRIDRAERDAGAGKDRPRVKFVAHAALRAQARSDG